MKTCKICELIKEKSEFYKGINTCKSCYSIKYKKYYKNNKEKIKNNVEKYSIENKEKIKEYQSEYRKENSSKEYNTSYYLINKEKIKEKSKEYALENKEHIKLYKKKHADKNKEKISIYINNYMIRRRQTEPLFKLKSNLRRLISIGFKRNGYTKKSKTYEILGCDYLDFKTHLESKFEPWMSWDNYGKYNGELNYGWDMDHIIPMSIANSEEEVIELNHYTNLQPLCSYTNRVIKKDKIF